MLHVVPSGYLAIYVGSTGRLKLTL